MCRANRSVDQSMMMMATCTAEDGPYRQVRQRCSSPRRGKEKRQRAEMVAFATSLGYFLSALPWLRGKSLNGVSALGHGVL